MRCIYMVLIHVTGISAKTYCINNKQLHNAITQLVRGAKTNIRIHTCARAHTHTHTQTHTRTTGRHPCHSVHSHHCGSCNTQTHTCARTHTHTHTHTQTHTHTHTHAQQASTLTTLSTRTTVVAATQTHKHTNTHTHTHTRTTGRHPCHSVHPHHCGSCDTNTQTHTHTHTHAQQAGILATLSTRTTVVAAVNPRPSWRSSQPISEATKMSGPLLSR